MSPCASMRGSKLKVYVSCTRLSGWVERLVGDGTADDREEAQPGDPQPLKVRWGLKRRLRKNLGVAHEETPDTEHTTATAVTSVCDACCTLDEVCSRHPTKSSRSKTSRMPQWRAPRSKATPAAAASARSRAAAPPAPPAPTLGPSRLRCRCLPFACCGTHRCCPMLEPEGGSATGDARRGTCWGVAVRNRAVCGRSAGRWGCAATCTSLRGSNRAAPSVFCNDVKRIQMRVAAVELSDSKLHLHSRPKQDSERKRALQRHACGARKVPASFRVCQELCCAACELEATHLHHPIPFPDRALCFSTCSTPCGQITRDLHLHLPAQPANPVVKPHPWLQRAPWRSWQLWASAQARYAA